MLDRISIDNFATIEHISFDLGEQLNIITGETGSGKSILVEAISTALGGRADISMVRTGSDKSIIQIAGTLDGREVIISRELMSSGKSISKLNGEMVTLAELREFCKSLVDIHGQYDNQQILDPVNHLSLTDNYISERISPELAKLSNLYDDFRAAKRAYDALVNEQSESQRQHDYYKFECDYIRALGLTPGEDEQLKSDIEMMRNSERIFQAVSNSYTYLHESDNSILTQLNRIMNDLSTVESYSEELRSLSADITDLYYKLEDASGSLRNINGKLTFSEGDMDAAQDRLSTIEDAKRKYGKSVEDIIAYGQDLERKLDAIANYDNELARLHDEMQANYESLEQQADFVSSMRKIAADRLQSEMMNELRDLEFANSDFKIEMQRADEIGPKGYDLVEFLISTNPEEPLRPLVKIASGGEISRIMLAFKRIIGNGDKTDTMIFDEIDTGISGKTAIVVGNKLKEIADHHQVICITHLPQIAAHGDDNYLISKSLVNGKSSTSIEHLDYEGKTRMIATLISGSSISESSLKAARELIEDK